VVVEPNAAVCPLLELVTTASRGTAAEAAAAGDAAVVEVGESEEVEAAAAGNAAVVEASCCPILIPHSSMRWDSLRISSGRSWATSGSMAAAKYAGAMEFSVEVGGTVVELNMPSAGGTSYCCALLESKGTDVTAAAAADAEVGDGTVGEVGVTGAADASENGTVVAGGVDAAAAG
jgi:hypothetical protein